MYEMREITERDDKTTQDEARLNGYDLKTTYDNHSGPKQKNESATLNFYEKFHNKIKGKKSYLGPIYITMSDASVSPKPNTW